MHDQIILTKEEHKLQVRNLQVSSFMQRTLFFGMELHVILSKNWTFQGTVKQLVNFTEAEGVITTAALCNGFLACLTDSGFLRTFDLTRRCVQTIFNINSSLHWLLIVRIYLPLGRWSRLARQNWLAVFYPTSWPTGRLRHLGFASPGYRSIIRPRLSPSVYQWRSRLRPHHPVSSASLPVKELTNESPGTPTHAYSSGRQSPIDCRLSTLPAESTKQSWIRMTLRIRVCSSAFLRLITPKPTPFSNLNLY